MNTEQREIRLRYLPGIRYLPSIPADKRKADIFLPRFLLSFAALTAVVACASGCSKTVKWEEEVQLSNGQVIVVERETHHLPGGAEMAIGTGWRPQQYVIRFKYSLSSDRTIEWRSTKMDAERATEPEFPLVLDVEADKEAPHLITIHWLRGACYEYVRYVYSGGVWTEAPLPDEFETRDANLYLPAAAVDVPSSVSLGLKGYENANTRYSARFRKIGPKQRDCRA